jgi:predicted nucleotidyltransferase
MAFVLQDQREEIAAVCSRLGVKRLDVFGSAVRTDFDPAKSDLDFVVQFAGSHGRGYADRYLALAEALEKLFARPVDLLTERSLRNPILQRAIAADRRTLYGG